MAVTLAEAKNNALEDYDPFVIDEFRKSSVILDSLIFDDAVNPAGGGATLDYSYRRQETQPTAEFRAINTEYSPSTTTTKKYSTTLAVLGGAFEIDRILANVGPKGSDEVTRNINDKVKAAITLFQDTVINGDVGVNDKAFDGLDKALTGSSTEMKPTSGAYDWTDLEGEKGNKAIDTLDEFLDLLDGTPTIVVGNKKALARVRAMVRRTSMYVREPIDGLANANGRPISRESYGGILCADAREAGVQIRPQLSGQRHGIQPHQHHRPARKRLLHMEAGVAEDAQRDDPPGHRQLRPKAGRAAAAQNVQHPLYHAADPRRGRQQQPPPHRQI